MSYYFYNKKINDNSKCLLTIFNCFSFVCLDPFTCIVPLDDGPDRAPTVELDGRLQRQRRRRETGQRSRGQGQTSKSLRDD